MENDSCITLEIIGNWQNIYEDLWANFGSCFHYKNTRQHAERYVSALLARIERKNGWQMAEYLGDKSPHAIQNFLSRAAWDDGEVRATLMQYAKNHLLSADEGGVLIVDETGFLKKGKHSAGVARQYSGTAGRVENTQIGVFLTLAGSKGRTLVDCELYLPKEWCEDEERRKDAHIPADITFKTKPQLAKAMLERAWSQSLKPDWVLGDSVYGSYDFRAFLEHHHQHYVLGIASQQRLWVDFRQVRIDKFVKEIPEKEWIRHSVGKGSKGERLYDWVSWPTGANDETGCHRYALVRRSVEKPDEYSYYFCYAPGNTPTQKLAEAAGKRWNIECCFETAKQETGLDEYEIRSWRGWYRHITLSMVALAYLSVTRFACRQADEAEKRGLLSLQSEKSGD